MHQSRNVIRYINAAHVIDHMFMLIFPAAVLGMGESFGLDFAQLIGLSLGGFIAFGACSLPAGWLGDRWSRRSMMLLFFFGIGAAAIFSGFTSTAPMLTLGLTLIGIFAAIYHPVGTAMLVSYARNRGREIGINGMWGNLGVAFSALVTGLLVAYLGWRAAFILPGAISILLGVLFALQVREEPIPLIAHAHARPKGENGRQVSMVMVFAVLALVTATGGVVFNATTMTYPKLFQERLHELFAAPQTLGLIVSLAYAFGAVAQLSIGRLRAVDPVPGAAAVRPGPCRWVVGDGAGSGADVRGVRPGHGERCDGRQLRCPTMAIAGVRLALLPVFRRQRHGDTVDCLYRTTPGVCRAVPGARRICRPDVHRSAGFSTHGGPCTRRASGLIRDSAVNASLGLVFTSVCKSFLWLI